MRRSIVFEASCLFFFFSIGCQEPHPRGTFAACSVLVFPSFAFDNCPPSRGYFENGKSKKQATRMRQRKSNKKKKRERRRRRKKKDTKNVKWIQLNETTSLSGRCIYNLYMYWFHCRTLCAPSMKCILSFEAFFFFPSLDRSGEKHPFNAEIDWENIIAPVAGFLLWIIRVNRSVPEEHARGTMTDRLWRHREGWNLFQTAFLHAKTRLDCKGLKTQGQEPLKRYQPRYSMRQKFISLHLSLNSWIPLAEHVGSDCSSILFKKARHAGSIHFRLHLSLEERKKNEPDWFLTVLLGTKCHLKRMVLSNSISLTL